MKRALFLVLLGILLISNSVHACTGYAVYSPKGIYFGMNYDLPTQEETYPGLLHYFDYNTFSVVIDSRSGVKTFALATDADNFNPFYNEYGVFGTTQDIYPAEFVEMGDEPYISYNAYYLMPWDRLTRRADHIRYQLEGNLELYASGPHGEKEIARHWLFADVYGDAFILEPGDSKNYILPISDDYIIMTNFLNHKLNSAQRIISILDSDGRYRRAERLIQSTIDDFSLDLALKILEETILRHTKLSVVIVPAEEKIYFGVLGDFSRIWQVDFVQETISAYKGFEEPRLESLDEKGISFAKLLEWK